MLKLQPSQFTFKPMKESGYPMVFSLLFPFEAARGRNII